MKKRTGVCIVEFMLRYPRLTQVMGGTVVYLPVVFGGAIGGVIALLGLVAGEDRK